MSNTTEMLKVHGFTYLSDLGYESVLEVEINSINQILPGNMFAVLNENGEPGVYVVEWIEVSSYTEA